MRTLTMLTWAPLGVLLVCLAATSISAQDAAPDETSATKPKLPSIFSYAHYLSHFGKRYGSQLEATTRHVYFLASAFQVYEAALAYANRLTGSYLALNHLSDLSPREWRLMQNKQADDDIEERPRDEDSNSAESVADLVDKVEAKVEARRGVRARRKRSIGAAPATKRQISMDMLVQPGRPLPERAQVMARVNPRPITNNPKHSALELAQFSRGLADQQKKVAWIEMNSNELEDRMRLAKRSVGRFLRVVTSNLREIFVSSSQNAHLEDGHSDKRQEGGRTAAKGEATKPDEMFVDLSQSDCMFRPRCQGTCGSCYAFAAITLAEWIYCKTQGKLVRFSEQYMVDCGRDYVEGLEGCEQGQIKKLSHFIHNFGLELARNYPYTGTEASCPYEPDQDLARAGFFRMNLSESVLVPLKRWPEVLERSPILVIVRVADSFYQWAGGIDDGANCVGGQNHAMVVVGHGREGGEEFWLIRNSYGTQWGQAGYYKLAKAAARRCVHGRRGYVFGSRASRGGGGAPLGEVELNQLNERVQREMRMARLIGRQFEIEPDREQEESRMWFMMGSEAFLG